ncbi:MAG: sigma-70 family RNA polymerase sigma factor [Kiritimatiellae bacterium]|nr:sigma-70 family RNA polymerase sigma factor [Kiritimatiellia bacterium]
MSNANEEHEVFVRVLEHRAAIMAVIVAMTRDFDAAEDIFQETVLEIVRSRDRFDETADFASWSKGIARHMVMRHWDAVKRKPTPLEQDTLEYLADVAQDEPDEDVWERERKGLRKCLEQLSERNRALFLTRYGRNLKGPKLARELGIRVGSLRTTLIRIRRFLRQCIGTQTVQSTSSGNTALS